ncbi:MAG: D-alanyl-D-alanine carboxypeptidase (penicillin-binding protein 5/6) [Gammaproteobacteria bacterium]|jgi:D-alanyl-D-alanine carboxypeptidase (penicillin-binding protein 5/6)
MMLILRRAFAMAMMIALLPLAVAAQAFDTRASAAYVFDQTTGTILLSKDADTPLPPASMSKLMTIYMAFEAVADGRLRIDEKLLVSQHAMDYGGSTMFLRAGERISVEDLLRGVIVLSGNDASAVLAEAISIDGTEAGFARMMTNRAREMGMMNSAFVNANGWPAVGHRMSMKDLGILADRLIADFPTYYPLFSEQEFMFDGRAPSNSQNRNPLLGLVIGADGLKTGHTSEAGYGLVGSAKQGDRRIIFVITGLDSAIARAQEAEKIVKWAFRQFAQKDVVRAGTKLADAAVWMGDQPTVGLTVAEDLSLLVPVLGIANGISAEIVYEGPFTAPITQGQQLGELVITLDGLPETRLPLVADRDVAKGGFTERLRTAAMVLWQRFAPTAQDAA